MPRIMLTYPDGQVTYGTLEFDADGAFIVLGGARYAPQDLAKSGMIAIVNNAEILRQLHDLGLPARPSPKQQILSVSLSRDTRERLKAASEATSRSISNIVEELAVKWLDERGF